MKTYLLNSLCLGFILFTVSCKKTRESTEPVAISNKAYLNGSWELSSPNTAGLKSIYLASDQTCVAYFIDPMGFNYSKSSTYSATETTLTIALPGISDSGAIYDYTADAGSLHLKQSGVELAGFVKLDKKPSVGTLVTAVEELTNKLGGPNSNGLAYDAGYLWGADIDNQEMVKIDMASKNSTRIWDKALICYRFEFVGGYIYRTPPGESVLYYHGEFSDLFGDPVFSAGKAIKGIAYPPASVYIWCLDADGQLYKFQKNSKKVMGSFNIGKGFTDVKWYNGNLLLLRNSFLYLFDPDTMAVTKIYELDNIGAVYGISPATGNDVWLNANGTLKRVVVQ